MNKAKHKFWGYVILGVLLVIFTISTYFIPGLQKFTSPEYVRALLISLGAWGYIIFIVLLVTAVLSPLPATPIILAGGYVYGLTIGSLLSLSSVIIGGSILFFLTKKIGEPLLEMFIDKHHVIHFRHILKKRGKVAALISYIVPIFPSTSVMLIMGLTGTKYFAFIILVIMGHIPRFLIMNSLGSDLQTGFTIKTILIALLGLVLVLMAAFREPLKKFFFKELKELKEEVKDVEKEVGLKK